ncbi:MAG: hypothetical protein J5608_00890 [Alphaproteobacteria bacterium]|nr:hypothetical protein [Alphaproteobacteria bacterium]
MRNVFLCLLTVLLFAPADLLAAGASSARSNTRGEVTTDASRTASNRASQKVRANNNSVVNRAEKSAPRKVDTVQRATRDTVSRSVTGRSAENVVPRNARATSVVSRILDRGRQNTVKQRKQSGTSRMIAPMAEFADDPMRNETVERIVSGRVAVVTPTASKEKKVTAQEIADAKAIMEQTSSLNKSCQEQYNECMDQFCAVVDTNQKRCSCSANLSKYANVQKAVTNANNELNQVAQRIRYVGLSADEIRAIMTETEAEAALDKNKDKSETRSMLSDIEKLIQDPTTKVSMVGDNEFGLDLDLDFSADDGTDLFSLDFLDGNNDSISSKRGTALYNAAKKRCKAILNSCTDVGATSNQITGNYELAIDKDCIAYEQGLNKMNETLKSNVRSAGLMLQKARLAVMQNKNQYDPKGCVAALETCMTDDMVCGSDYSKCLDPTKKYIDENGNVVLGQDITNITEFMENFNNAAIDNLKLSSAQSVVINESSCKDSPNNDGACVIKYLLSKIGTGATVKDGGLCRAVLDKCQQYTYNASGEKYNPYNDIVINYVQRAMVNIKSFQQKIISDYASSCMNEVASCYNQQVTQVNSWSSVASVSSIKGVMTGACRNVALTCAYAVFANMCTTSGTLSAGITNAMNWVLSKQCADAGNDDQVCIADDANTTCTPCDVNNQAACIEGISEMFYQSLLCPENATYDTSCYANGAVGNRVKGGCSNTQCRCNAGYTSWNNSCVQSCEDNEYRDTYGTCQKCAETSCTTSEQAIQDTNVCSGGATFDTTCVTATIDDGIVNGCSTNQCRCGTDTETWQGACMTPCANNEYRNDSGTCETCTPGTCPASSASPLELP